MLPKQQKWLMMAGAGGLLAFFLTFPLRAGGNSDQAVRETAPGGATALSEPSSPRGIWFEDLGDPLVLAEPEQQMVGQYIAGALLDRPTGAALPEKVRRDGQPRIVFLSIGDGTSPARVIRGAGTGLAQALGQAIAGAQQHAATGTRPRWLKLDIVQQAVARSGVNPRAALERDRSLFGLAFGRQHDIALLPQELIGRNLVNQKQVITFQRLADYLADQPRLAAAAAKIAQSKTVDLHHFKTTALFMDGREVVPLFRGHRRYDTLSAPQLLAAARRAGYYLADAVGPDGRFAYSYLPDRDRVTSKYNILRHAGTIYSMLELYEVTKSKQLLDTAERAIDYLLDQVQPAEPGDATAVCIVEDGFVKLGGNALAMVALAKHMDVTQSDRHKPILLKLGNWIRQVQEDSGRFGVHKMAYPAGTPTDFVSNYYPGEAILALTRTYAHDPQEYWLDTAEKAAQYLILVRDQDKPLSRLNHDHWLLYGLNELYRQRSEPVYLAHARRIVSAITERQNRVPEYPDWMGSYYKPPRSTPTAIRTEGLCAAYRLFKDYGYSDDAAAASEAAQLGIAFQLQTQFGPETAMYVKNPRRVLGGFHKSLTNYEIRIDYVQHNISALLQLSGMLGEGAGLAKLPTPQPLTQIDFPSWIKAHLNGLEWVSYDVAQHLNRTILLESLDLGREFLINNQKPAGNFNYMYDFVEQTQDPNDSQVRQAGALWGLTLIMQYQPNPQTQAAVDKGLKFFFDCTQNSPGEGALLVAYPGNRDCRTGTVALLALSIIDYLRTVQDSDLQISDDYRQELTSKLNGYLAHLKYARLDNKHFSQSVSLLSMERSAAFSPYFDGESLLCLTKAAKYLGRSELIPLIEESAMVLAKYYTSDAWQQDADSNLTKGFFQWGCMAFWEYQDAGWSQAETFGDCLLSLAWWMIHTHETLRRRRNTAYAYEGIIHAYRLAEARKDEAALRNLAYAIDRGLHKLTSWQVGGPLVKHNAFLLSHATDDPLAVGGVMNHHREPPLRIDVAQHQMAAVVLALKHVYQEDAQDQ